MTTALRTVAPRVTQPRSAVAVAVGTKTVSVLIVTHNRSEELFDTVESVLGQSYPKIELIVVENGSRPEVVAKNRVWLGRHRGVRYRVLKENLGVSGGRNVALGLASGAYQVEIDDDVVFAGHDTIDRLVEFMDSNPHVGVVAFKISDGQGREVRRWEYPFLDKSRDTKEPGACGWFIGAGHAFNKAMLERVGRYRDFAPWGEEEQDLSLRVLDAGYEIFYLPQVHIHHKQSPNGRIRQRWRKGGIHLSNKLKVSLLNLPWTSVVTYALIRTAHFTVHYRDVRVPLLAAAQLARQWRYIRDHRKRISREALRRLSSLRGHRYF